MGTGVGGGSQTEQGSLQPRSTSWNYLINQNQNQKQSWSSHGSWWCDLVVKYMRLGLKSQSRPGFPQMPVGDQPENSHVAHPKDGPEGEAN